MVDFIVLGSAAFVNIRYLEPLDSLKYGGAGGSFSVQVPVGLFVM
jgi:hypothetical protein